MLTLDSISLHYSSKVIFDCITATIGSRDRIGLVGSNGAGKSTLLKTILGETTLDGGVIIKPNYLTIGYLPQDGIIATGKPLIKEVETAFEDVITIQKRLDESNVRLHQLEENSQEYFETLDIIGALEHRLHDLDAYRMQSKIEKVLLGLGFQLEDMEKDTGEFSGGWQMRIALAKLLLKQPSILLLDEPTNHLDLPSLRWVESFLKKYEGAMMIISHDQGFLDELTTRTFALSMGNLYVYEGNYSFYVKAHEERKELLKKMAKNQQKRIEKTQKFIDRFRYKSSKAKAVQSRIKALDKEDIIELENEENTINFKFPQAPLSGQVVVAIKNVNKSYDDKEVIHDLTFKIEKGERIAVVGVNGAGKSTLAKIIAGNLPPTSGEVELGYKVKVGYYAQQQAEALDLNKTVLEVAEDMAGPGMLKQVRNFLGAFLFQGDDVFKRINVLSGGERCRVALAGILMQSVNFLILDEPTNHLDINSQTKLQHALKDYTGTLFIISHDRRFLDPLVTKVLEVSPGSVRTFLGNVSEYLEKVEADSISEVGMEKSKPTTQQVSKESSKERRRKEAEKRAQLVPLKKQLGQLEDSITQFENEKNKLEKEMMDPEFFKQGDLTRENMERYHSLERKLERSYSEWDKLEQKIAGLKSDTD